MGKKRWFDKEASLDSGEVILADVDSVEEVTETFDAVIEQESANVEVTVPTESASITDNSDPTQAEIKFAKGFTGTPTPVSDYAAELAQSCARKKLLAEFDTGTFARGSQWHIYCKR